MCASSQSKGRHALKESKPGSAAIHGAQVDWLPRVRSPRSMRMMALVSEVAEARAAAPAVSSKAAGTESSTSPAAMGERAYTPRGSPPI